MKRLIAFALVLTIACFSLSGCSGNNSASNAPMASTATTASASAGGSVVNIGLASDPNDLSPFSAPSLGRVSIMKTLYQTLVDQDKFGGEMVGVLIKSYEKVSDLDYKATLYDDIVDHAGNQLTAQDIVFCYDTAIKLGNLPKLNAIDSIKALDNHTVEFKFKKLQVGDLAVLWSECPIVTQKAYEASKDQMATTPVGTGPYKMTKYVSGNSITFEKTDNYWQKDESKINVNSQANVDKIVYQVIPEPSQMTVALETGKIDISSSISSADLTRFQQGGADSANFTVTQSKENLTDVLEFSCYKTSPFANNQALRQAVAYAVDGNAIVKGALKGQGIASKIYGNSKYPDYNKEWDTKNYYAYDLAKAKELLAKSGYKTGTPIRLMTTTTSAQANEGTIIQAALSELGITVKVSSYEASLYNTYKLQPDKWDFMVDQAGSTDYIVNVWKLDWDNTAYKYGAINFASDDKLQSLLMTACSLEGHTQENVDAFNEYFMDQCYGFGLAEEYDNFVHSKKITAIVLDCKSFMVPGACKYSF